MIATNEAVDILRHGWQDAATTLADDVPEVAELLEARLEMAVATQRLTEGHLLDTIQEVESVTSRAGSPSGQALARRLRRTVYEYLLALDAARPLETAKASVEQPAMPTDSPMVGAEEVAALGHASRSPAVGEPEAGEPSAPAAEAEVQTVDPQATQAAAAESDLEPAAESDLEPAAKAADAATLEAPAAPRRWFGLRRRQRHTAQAPDAAPDQAVEPIAGDEAAAVEPIAVEEAAGVEPLATDAIEPTWYFSPAPEPALFHDGPELEDATAADVDTAAGDVEVPEDAATSGPSAEPDQQDQIEILAADEQPSAAAGPHEAPDDDVPAFVAPRAGFHIVEDAPAHRADQAEPRLEMPTFTVDEENHGHGEVTAPVAADPGPDPGAGFLAWRPPVTSHVEPGEVPVATPPAPAAQEPAAQEPAAPAEQSPPVQTPPEEQAESRGWGLRRQGDGRSARQGAPAAAAPPLEDDPFETNSRLSDMRRRIEERLRRKRCDEAAALLQEIAQETGGRAVADLAMNSGDRCRALGKTNAALNCYLAAARSDPIYELPLGRLADICIDNQDTDLAVSYLERIARIYRFREEDAAAIRTYRRIVTIAPYRDDVLTLLMNAQRTGQLQ